MKEWKGMLKHRWIIDVELTSSKMSVFYLFKELYNCFLSQACLCQLSFWTTLLFYFILNLCAFPFYSIRSCLFFTY